MHQTIYTSHITISPDYCDLNAALSPSGVFTILQAVSSEHAEQLGIGVTSMFRNRKFWLTSHNRVDFIGTARIAQELTVRTWAVPCEPDSFKCYRNYSLHCGDRLVALGKTQWAILGPEGKPLPFRESGFPEDYQFSDETGIPDEPAWFSDDFTEEDQCDEHLVRSTEVDFGRHMNNIAYIRMLLDQFPAKQITGGRIRSIEIHYGTPCLENERLTIYRKWDGNTARMAVRNSEGRTAAMASIVFVITEQ